MENERKVELDCIAAIFPELVLDPSNPFSSSVDLPVSPQAPVQVDFVKRSDALPTPPHSGPSPVNVEPTNGNAGLWSLSYLPSLHLHITLPDGYPEEQPPAFKLSSTPLWLSRDYLDELEAHGQVMWEEAGHSAVVFGYIDFLQQNAELAFGFAGTILEVPGDFQIPMLDFDIQAKQAAFRRETFDCGICLEPKKGSVCYRMLDCGHVFCVQCLQDYYSNAIKEGDLTAVRCPDPGCVKQHSGAQSNDTKKAKIHLSPSELLQVPLELDMVTRYVRLKHKADLESDKNTVYCPRKWCQGAARSKKHRKPVGLELDDASDDESDEEVKEASEVPSRRDLLSVCEDCTFAFCNKCYHGWHGEFTICMPLRRNSEVTKEEEASMEYINRYTASCPTCSAPAQKSHGCNHMICFTCRSHFCYLCSAWLSPWNPYIHFNTENSGCYMRLWDLENGHGDDVEIGDAGGPEAALEEIPEELPERVAEMRLETPGEIAEEAPVAREALEREGPLVLRINELPPQPVPVQVVPPPGRLLGGRLNGGQPAQNQVRHQDEPRQARGRGGALQNRRRVNLAERQRAPPEPVLRGVEPAHQAWVRMFVEMALNDEEDQLESDEEGEGAWEIPLR